MAQAFDLFKNSCAGCGKTILSYATDRQGTLPIRFCNGICETNYEDSKRMTGVKNIVLDRKTMSTDELTQRMSKTDWNEYKYLKEEIPM